MMNFLKKIFSSLNNNSDMNKYLILGIGNIGSEYDDTRHNICLLYTSDAADE